MAASAGTAQLVRTVSVKANGSPLGDSAMERLVESRVSQSIGAASRLELRFDDDDFALVDGTVFDIGGAIEVAHSDEKGTESRVFIGKVTAIGIEQVGGTLHQLVIEAFDQSYRLSQVSRVRTFLNSSYSDIASKIALENGLKAQVASAAPIHEYILQQGTDWAMLDEIAARTGMEWLVDGDKLIVRKRPATVGQVVELGVELVKFRARYSGAQHVQEVQVRGWDPTRKQPIVGSAKPGSSAAPPATSNPAGAAAFRRSAAGSTGKMVTAALNIETQAEAELAANTLAIRNASHELSARGELLGNPKVKAGEHLTVKGVGKKMGGDYYVTSVEHIFGRGDLITRFIAGGPERESIVDLLGGQPAAVGGWATNGLVSGLITNIKDPDGLNRVKVKFPALSEADESFWARIASPMAGGGVGLVMMPSINDEVLVGFEQGDFRRPYVLGSLWNDIDKPPFALDGNGKIIEYALKTVSGHVMSFGEESGKEAIKFVNGKAADTKLVMEERKVQLWVQGDNMVEIKAGGATIVLDKGNIKISGKSIEIKGDTELKLSAPTIEIKAGSQLKLGGAMVELKASATAKVEAAAMLELKGAMTKIN